MLQNIKSALFPWEIFQVAHSDADLMPHRKLEQKKLLYRRQGWGKKRTASCSTHLVVGLLCFFFLLLRFMCECDTLMLFLHFSRRSPGCAPANWCILKWVFVLKVLIDVVDASNIKEDFLSAVSSFWFMRKTRCHFVGRKLLTSHSANCGHPVKYSTINYGRLGVNRDK